MNDLTGLTTKELDVMKTLRDNSNITQLKFSIQGGEWYHGGYYGLRHIPFDPTIIRTLAFRYFKVFETMEFCGSGIVYIDRHELKQLFSVAVQ